MVIVGKGPICRPVECEWYGGGNEIKPHQRIIYRYIPNDA